MFSENQLIKNRAIKVHSVIIQFSKDHKKQIIYSLLILILILSTYIRTLNIESLEGKYPLESDPFLFLRYTKEIAEKGTLNEIDHMRYAPIGYNTSGENTLLSYIMVYLYQFLKLFNPNITIEQATFIYPVIAFALTLLVFFFLVKNLFEEKAALLATAFFAVIPNITLYRTMYGFADKEALGLLLMMLSFYFYITGLQKEKTKSKLIYGSLAGISTGLMSLIWGGFQFVLVTITLFTLIELLTERIKLENYYIHLIWSLFTIYFLTKSRYEFKILLESTTITLVVLSLIVFTLYYLILKFKPGIKTKLEKYLPLGVLSLFISFVLGIFGGSIIRGPSFLIQQITNLISRFSTPIGTSTLIQTISEAQTATFSWWWKPHYFLLIIFIIGAITLFYTIIKDINFEFKNPNPGKKVKYHKFYLLIIFSLIILGIIFTNSITLISRIIYSLPIFIFGIYSLIILIYGFYKDKDLIKEIQKIDTKYVFIFTWLIISMIAAKGAVRLFIITTPIIALISSYLIIKIYNYTINSNDKLIKKLGIIILLIVLIFPSNVFSINTKGSLLSLTSVSLSDAKKIQPIITLQWRSAMNWLEQATPENSVIASWWDYGYWIQTAGNRSTVLDGGNAIGYWNYLMARQVLTSNNSIDALEFLKTHNVTHLIIPGEDIGKYNPISFVGSNNNDRYSTFVPLLVLPEYTKVSQNTIFYYFRNDIKLYEDFKFNNKIYSKEKSKIVNIILPTTITNDEIKFNQPKATISMGTQTDIIPLECLFYQKTEITFNEPGLKGCLMIIDYADKNGKDKNIKSGIYISPKSRETLFTKLYLFEKEIEGFNLIYTSKEYNPEITFYRPTINLLGPIRIWEINYPENIKTKSEYLLKEDPTGKSH